MGEEYRPLVLTESLLDLRRSRPARHPPQDPEIRAARMYGLQHPQIADESAFEARHAVDKAWSIRLA
jgi:hypothetical protein